MLFPLLLFSILLVAHWLVRRARTWLPVWSRVCFVPVHGCLLISGFQHVALLLEFDDVLLLGGTQLLLIHLVEGDAEVDCQSWEACTMLEHSTMCPRTTRKLLTNTDGALKALVKGLLPILLLIHGHVDVLLEKLSAGHPRVLLLVLGKATGLQLVELFEFCRRPLLGWLIEKVLPCSPAGSGAPSVNDCDVIGNVGVQARELLTWW